MSEIISAKYGHGDSWGDCTALIQTLQKYGTQCTVCNDLCGDPAYGQEKDLVVQFEDGSTHTWHEGQDFGIYKPETPIDTVNLIYHICPLSFNRRQWIWNIEHLKSLGNWINGKRVLAVMQSKDCDPVDMVLEKLEGFRFDHVVVRLNHVDWEMTTFPAALELIQNTNRNEALIYAHAKGVRRSGDQLEAARIWTEAMYNFIFGNPEKLKAALIGKRCVGALRADDIGFWGTTWHYYGNFWAVRHDQIPYKKWHPSETHRYFIEFWLPTFIDIKDSGILCPVRYPYNLDNQLDHNLWRKIEHDLDLESCRWRMEE